MDSIDLSSSFVTLVNERHQNKPDLRLESDLKKVNAVIVSYAKAIGTTRENLSILQVCADCVDPHPLLIKHIESQDLDAKYQGQHISRFRKLIKNLPWPKESKNSDELKPAIFAEQIPLHLREVWFLLPRINGISSKGVPKPDRKQHRTTLPLSTLGLAIGSALLKVSNTHNITDLKSLIEEGAGIIILTLKSDNPPRKWSSIEGAFYLFRRSVRSHIGYVIEKEPRIHLLLDELPEPLQSQVRTYIERARNGCKSNQEIIKLAKTKYGLEIKRHSEETISCYIARFLFGLGFIYREKSAQVTDIKDLLRLETRVIVVDEISIPELYNPLVDCYRNYGLGLSSDRKEVGFDTNVFRSFIEALEAIAAFNGFLHLRKLFQKEYTTTIDIESKKKRKERKKELFDRPWLNRQIQRLKVEFYEIANKGSFKNSPSGILRIDARRDLNLCLFYLTLITLRFLGVRQQSLRDCKPSENIIFISYKEITFHWPETKNGKGILHRLNAKDHAETHKDLIEGIWIFYKKIYPYLSGTSTSDLSSAEREIRRKKVAGQFFLKCNLQGLCIPFEHSKDFLSWFSRQAKLFLDFEGRTLSLNFHPHFVRALFGDWLRFDLGFSAELSAAIAADSEKVFESDYVSHPNTFDATELWTNKNKELKASSTSQKEKTKSIRQEERIKQYEEEKRVLLETINTQAETIKKLTDKKS